MKRKVLIAAVCLLTVMLATGVWLIAAEGEGDEAGTATSPASAEAVEPTPEEAVAPASVEAPLPSSGEVSEAPGAEAAEPDVVVIPVAREEEGMPEGVTVTNEAGEKISIKLESVEIQEVVKLFTRMTDANIIFKPNDTNLQGTVNVYLQNVGWKPALDAILAQRRLMLQDTGEGVYTIVTRPVDAPEPLIMETIFLKFATVKDLTEAVKANLNPRGRITGFPSRNALIIQTTAANMTEIKVMIDRIDIPRKQVFIEAKFMELNDTAIKDLGINWQMVQAYEISGSKSLLQQTENITESKGRSDSLTKGDSRTITDGPRNASAGTSDGVTETLVAGSALTEAQTWDLTDVRSAVLSPLDFRLVLSAFKGRDGVSVVSNPKIIVANGETAQIHIGEVRRPFIATVTPPSQYSAAITTYNPGDEIDIGVKLDVTPTINTEDNITVEIKPELSRLVAMDTSPDGTTTYPIIATKTIKTQFNLQSGRTVAIGGLTETEDTESIKKIPILGDIPLLGTYLFSHKSDSKAQRETIIFVTVGLATPETMERETGMPGGTRLAREQEVREGDSKQDFEYNLEKMKQEAKAREEKAEKRKRRLLKRAR